MFEPCNIDIMGALWSIKYQTAQECKFLEDADGITDYSTHEIIIQADNPNDIGNMDVVRKIALRHEIIHAYLYECGLGCNFEHANKFGHEETMVDWVARIFPRILKTYQELGVA